MLANIWSSKLRRILSSIPTHVMRVSPRGEVAPSSDIVANVICVEPFVS